MRLAKLAFRFTLLSLALVLVAALSIGFLVRDHELRQLSSQIEDRNTILAQVFMNLLSNDLKVLLESPVKSSDDKSITELLSKVGSIVRDSEIIKLKLYNLRGQVVFSTDVSQLGETKHENPGFQAALSGQAYSELTHRNRFSTSEGERVDVDLVASYVPVKKNETIVAVFELYHDVTELLSNLQTTLWQTLAIVLGIFAAIYSIHVLIIYQAQKAIRHQEHELEMANQTLDQRVTDRTRELEESEHRIGELLAEQKLIFDNAQVGILLLKNRRIVKGNQRIADMFGYANPTDFEGQSTEIFYCSHADFLAAGQSG